MAISSKSRNEGVSHFVFLLLPKFSLNAFASAVEPLRIANRAAERQLYDWTFISEDGAAVTCSCGTSVGVSAGFIELSRDQTIIVCGGIDIKSATTKPVMGWLRRESRKGMALGAVCTGSYVLAKAGLLTNRRVTIHWENRESFLEEFPDLELSTAIFTIDKNRYSSAGGAASLDLMLKLIGMEHGANLANAVADQMIHTSIRTDKDDQRLSIPTRIGVRHPKLSKVIHMMDDNLEEPISPSDLAREVGMSTRQLERLFRRYLDRSPKRYYMELRLKKSRNLLLQTEMSVINVALACGFSSPSHFSKCYRSYFEITPYRERGAQET